MRAVTFDDVRAWRDRLAAIAVAAGAKAFWGIPEMWFERPHWLCVNGHVSARYLKSEERGCLCLACHQPVIRGPQITESEWAATLPTIGAALPAAIEWTRDDAPAVGIGTDDRRCASCGNWSQWLGETGDCLFHAYRKAEAIVAARGAAELAEVREAWPSKSARITSADEGCDGWKRIETR